MTENWILRVGDGNNLFTSSSDNIWGIQTKTSPAGKNFINCVSPGDKMWFVTSNSHGKIVAVATYRSHNERELGPLLNISKTDTELGWGENDMVSNWNTEIHYTNLYNLKACDNMLTYIKSPLTVRRYSEKCRLDLTTLYPAIVNLSKATLMM